jgi:hypothetical protein
MARAHRRAAKAASSAARVMMLYEKYLLRHFKLQNGGLSAERAGLVKWKNPPTDAKNQAARIARMSLSPLLCGQTQATPGAFSWRVVNVITLSQYSPVFIISRNGRGKIAALARNRS